MFNACYKYLLIWFFTFENIFNVSKLINWHTSLTAIIAFLVDKWITCFVTDIYIESWVWPQEKDSVMVEPNPVGALIHTWRHDGGHSSMDSVCWKCKQACICFSAYESDLLYFISNEKAQNTLGEKFIYKKMKICVINFQHWISLIHFKIFFNLVWNMILHLWKHV